MITLKLNAMDHVVYPDSDANELEDLIKGKKSMIIRGAEGRKLPFGKVNEGDILYFINKKWEGKVKARGVVTSVYSSDKLSEEESFETIIRNQEKLQLPDEQFEKLAGKKCLVLITLNDIEEIEPFQIDMSNFTNMDDWLPVGEIEQIALR